MSFILDALRKSEHERQRQAGPDIAQWRAPTPRSAIPLWVLALAALLAVNLVVVAVVVLRDPPAAPPAAEAATPAPVAQLPDPAAATPASAAPPLSPQPSAPAPPAAASMAANPPFSATPDPVAMPDPAAVPPLPTPMPAPSETSEVLPTIHELNLQGAQALPTLHLDIHVYAVRPAERFVFINMRKYREGGQTPEGILVERITPQGVVLDRNGLRFLLPRR